MPDHVLVTLDREKAETFLSRFPTDGLDSGLGDDQRHVRDQLQAALTQQQSTSLQEGK